MSGEPVQQDAEPTVMIPLGAEWWVSRVGRENEDAEPFPTEKAAKLWGGEGCKPERRPREVEMARPTDGQALVLTRVMRMLERGEVAEALMAFGDVMDALLVRSEDRSYAYQGLAAKTIQTTEFGDLILDCMEHFGIEAKANGRPGGAAPRKRAAARRQR